MLSECCDARPWNDSWNDVCGIIMGVCDGCGEHAAFYDDEKEEEDGE